jgi:hypothetical protein
MVDDEPGSSASSLGRSRPKASRSTVRWTAPAVSTSRGRACTSSSCSISSYQASMGYRCSGSSWRLVLASGCSFCRRFPTSRRRYAASSLAHRTMFRSHSRSPSSSLGSARGFGSRPPVPSSDRFVSGASRSTSCAVWRIWEVVPYRSANASSSCSSTSCDGDGEVCSRERLLQDVWGYSFDPGSNVVDVCVGRLRSKLGGGLIETVRNVGYRIDAS